jgi:hypothetical protein
LVNHQGQFPSVPLSFNLPPGTSVGAAVTAIQQATPFTTLVVYIYMERLGGWLGRRRRAFPRRTLQRSRDLPSVAAGSS